MTALRSASNMFAFLSRVSFLIGSLSDFCAFVFSCLAAPMAWMAMSPACSAFLSSHFLLGVGQAVRWMLLFFSCLR